MITIIVVIILAAVVILTLNKNNPIESAKEARFKEDVRTFQDELALTVSKQYTAAGGHRDEKITTSDFEKIKDYIPSFSEMYKDKFVIEDDELKYYNVSEDEKMWCESINVYKKNMSYTELEYLESTGEQWIDTEVIPNINTGFYLDFILLSKVDLSDYGILLGSSKRNSGSWGGITISSWASTSGGQMTYGVSNAFYNPMLKSEERMWIKLQNNIYETSTEAQIVFNNLGNLENNIWGTLYILAANNDEFLTPKKAKMKIYNVKLYDKDKIIRDYIPVLDGSEKPALYDKVEGKFYYNQGTGKDFKYKLKE